MCVCVCVCVAILVVRKKKEVTVLQSGRRHREECSRKGKASIGSEMPKKGSLAIKT